MENHLKPKLLHYLNKDLMLFYLIIQYQQYASLMLFKHYYFSRIDINYHLTMLRNYHQLQINLILEVIQFKMKQLQNK